MNPSRLIAVAALLAGCVGAGPDAQVHSVEYYEAHPAEARQAYRPGDCGGENYVPVPQTNRRRNCENAMLSLVVKRAQVATAAAPTVIVHAAPAAAAAAAAAPPAQPQR